MKKTEKEKLQWRLQRYKDALEYYKCTIRESPGFAIGICLSLALGWPFSVDCPDDVKSMKRKYPELCSFIPKMDYEGIKITNSYTGYFWPIKDSSSRINALEGAIKIAEEKLKAYEEHPTQAL